ncbi:glycosyltransferase family 4 protein [Parenemella sanctibonifatiensis]|uniref:Mannosyltransferase n=1 Tax=Parenemella sanctibonifatiensis TaxID=2016505 RepID=A0A255E8L3_9ACTN|nr:glycosyltransferase family 1 protein [Parenemella sanctibonifatiensis]OYN87908.1 mannosyltransferase [Parenemella sanctibonifatiensis]
MTAPTDPLGRPLRVIFDLRWTADDIAGISRFSVELAKALAARPEVELTVLVCRDDQTDLVPGVAKLRVHDPRDPGQALAEARLPRLLNRLEPDVVYCPVFYMGSWGRRYQAIFTIHDMIPFHFPKPPSDLSLGARIGWRALYATTLPMRWMLRQADRVATVSQTARAEIEGRLVSGDLAVIPNGVEQLEPAPPADHSGSDDIVYMGVFSQHKNVETLIRALPQLARVRLRLLSRIDPGRRAELTAVAHEAGVGDRIIFHDGVSDQEYADLLAQARCLVTASRLEGFGLPIVEAQQRGVPVVCSDIPIFHEVTGEVATFFDPSDPADCARAIDEAADPELSLRHSTDGLANAARYTWPRAAEAALELFRAAI